MPEPGVSVPVVERRVEGRDGREGVSLRFPYDPGVVASLKDEIPARDRYWNGEMWWVAAEHADPAVQILQRRWNEVMFIGLDGESDYLMDRNGAVTYQASLFDV